MCPTPFRAFGGPNSADMACWDCSAMDGLSVSISVVVILTMSKQLVLVVRILNISYSCCSSGCDGD